MRLCALDTIHHAVFSKTAKGTWLHAPKYALKYTPDCSRLHTPCLLDLRSQLSYQDTTLPGMLSRTLPIALNGTLPACLTIRSQVSSQNALKHTPKHAFKYTPNCTRWHSQFHSMTLPAYLALRSQIHSQEARYSQSNLTICSHVCFWVLDPETCWVAGARHREAWGWWRVAGGRWWVTGGIWWPKSWRWSIS